MRISEEHIAAAEADLQVDSRLARQMAKQQALADGCKAKLEDARTKEEGLVSAWARVEGPGQARV